MPEPSLRAESGWRLGRLSLTQLVRQVLVASFAHDIFDRAAALAFSFLFALFPLLVFFIALVGLFAAHRTALLNRLLAHLTGVMPAGVLDLLRAELNELSLITGRGTVTFGIVAALWFGAGALSSMISAFNTIYAVPERRSWFRIRATALALTLALSVTMFLSLTLLHLGGYLVSWAGSQLGLSAMLSATWSVARWLGAALFALVSFSTIYYFGPALEHRRWHWITPGSVVGVVLWFAASVGFRTYLFFFNNYGATYGSLGAAIILMMWMYVSGLAFLVGAEVNAAIGHAHRAQRTPPGSAGSGPGSIDQL
jgi:membrane protein